MPKLPWPTDLSFSYWLWCVGLVPALRPVLELDEEPGREPGGTSDGVVVPFAILLLDSVYVLGSGPARPPNPSFLSTGPGPARPPEPSLLSTGPGPAQPPAPPHVYWPITSLLLARPVTSIGQTPHLYWPDPSLLLARPLTSIGQTPHFYT